MIYVLVKESTYNNHDEYECLYSSFDRNKVESIRIQKIELHKKHVIAYQQHALKRDSFHTLYHNQNIYIDMTRLDQDDLYKRTIITFRKSNDMDFKDKTGLDFVHFSCDIEFKIVEVELI